MAACPECRTEVPEGSRFCPGCGAMQSSVSQMPTEMAPASGSGSPPPLASRTVTTPIGRLESSVSFAGAAFQPGQVLAGRYRIIGLLGRGGMGEVYRADDLELQQAVALKFLGRMFAERPDMLDRFRAEVRNARGVSHPNVCRVHDIGEVEGQTFLSMEYVDGEDLGSLLKRIGRLPRAKADEVARQLCAGLAAAHDRGVIHRDLKPSNIMIDGEGRVRIADFGLAVRGDAANAGEVVGTPAYMAPEQFDGKPATPQTDLYALGLILYEVHTGRRAFNATTWEGWKSQHSQVEPRSPDELERDIDEPVVRVILRCLEKDPANRPRSAMQLAASLPGGDPIAAALAAGETPSPQMVAAAGGAGSTTWRNGLLWVGGFVALLAVYLAIAPAATDLGLAPFNRGHDALRTQAQDAIKQLGYTQQPRDEATWFERDYLPMVWRARREPSTRWRRDYAAHGTPLQFWYRSSPEAMNPLVGSRVNAEDPLPFGTGMITVRTDAEGRLRSFLAVPPREDTSGVEPGATHVGELFALAALDTSRFHEVPSRWRPLLPFDIRREWEGDLVDRPGVPMRVTAAWWRGKPVSFGVRGPWEEIAAQRAVRRGNPISQVVQGLMAAALIALGIASGGARLRHGKSDWRGGLRLVNVLLILNLLQWLFAAHHTLQIGGEARSLFRAFGVGLTTAFTAFFTYLAIEPEVRRRTPELLIGWARLLQGRWRDARVGRDVLVGSVAGAASATVLAFAVTMTLLALGAENPVLEIPGAIFDGILVAYVISRHGLLALVTLWGMRLMFIGIPAPFQPISPYAFSAFVAVIVPVALVLFAFRTGASSGVGRSET